MTSIPLRFLMPAIATFAIACFDASAAETRFTIVDSSPSSWVARGYKNYTVTPSDGWSFTTSRNFHNGVNFRIDGPPLPGTTVDRWRVEFAAPFRELVTPGFYPDFQRFPFQDFDRPGLWFASTGRGDNRASGFFEVFEARYGPAGEVLSFSDAARVLSAASGTTIRTDMLESDIAAGVIGGR